jgi:uncharacterized protein DUF6884
VIVVGCGKRKLAAPAPACELYTGSLFVAARKYAEASGQKWAILSAAHGIVSPETVLAPYDVKLKLKGSALGSWALDAAHGCARLQQQWGLRESVEVLAGHPYAWPFRNELWWAEDLPSTEPLEGLGLGARLSWLSQALARVKLEREGAGCSS